MSTATTRITPRQLAQQQEYCGKLRAYWQDRGRVPTAFVDTYGCQQNEADSERIRGLLADCGYTFQDTEEAADVIVINTCAVREHAEQRVLGNIGALVHTRRRHPEQQIFLCGCMAAESTIQQKIKTSYPHVRGIFTPHYLWRLPELLYQAVTTGKRVYALEESGGTLAEGLPVVRSGSVKAWLSVMYGCNNFCTYCIVPYVRGRERSRSPEDVLAEARSLIAAGYKDITLLGQNVNSYGRDLGAGMDFSDLLAAIAAMDGEFCLRFMTSHPKDASKKLFDTMAAWDKIAKHIHLPFQCGSDRILKAMNRNYTVEQYRALVDYARSVMPELVITSDVIVGFPGETEEDFQGTMDLIRAVEFDSLFTFIYSPRPGTPAAKFPDPEPKQAKSRRFDELVAAQNEISERKLRPLVGRTLRCLIDGRDSGDAGLLTARTDGGRLVRLPGSGDLIGRFRNVTITDSTTWSLTGVLAEDGPDRTI